MSALLVMRAWTELLYVDVATLFGFSRIKYIVGPALPHAPSLPDPLSSPKVQEVLKAVRLARVLYIKPVWCLQHSAAVTRLLRRRGVPAEVVIGCHLAPMRAHAWVEVSGEVVAQEIDRMEHYCILDRW